METGLTAERQRLRAVLENCQGIGLAFLFGSTVRDVARQDSDLDVAVAGYEPLSPAIKLEVMDQLAAASGRPVDLVDLSSAPAPLLRQVMTTGLLCRKDDPSLYARLLRKLWYDQADIMPNYNLVLEKRRRKFIHGPRARQQQA